MTYVRVGKTRWRQEITDWLTSHLLDGKYGFNRETLDPDYYYFEYWFINGEDATAFSLTFSETINENRIYRI